jgi:2-haloacid dehalogenase
MPESEPLDRLEAVVFDLGGVLIDWNPRHLFRKIFDGDETAMEHFLSTVCTPAWNDQQDRGRPFEEGIAHLMNEHPDFAEPIRAYRSRWIEMLAGPIPGSVEILSELREHGTRIFALSNWSAETYPEARDHYPFLSWFQQILLSGEVGLAKPDAAIFELACKRFGIGPATSLFIDDSLANVEGARDAGFQATHFRNADSLRRELVAAGLLPG